MRRVDFLESAYLYSVQQISMGVPLKTKLSKRGSFCPDFLLQKDGCSHRNVSGRLPVPAFHPDDRLSRNFIHIA